jgi:hypothetical protein
VALWADFFFFLRGMSEREPFYRMGTSVLLRCFSYDDNANLLPIIPASFQQFSEKECGKQQ